MEEDFTESMIPAIAHLDCSNRELIFFLIRIHIYLFGLKPISYISDYNLCIQAVM